MSQAENPISVLFVCTGNICRSPTAEAVFRHQVGLKGLDGKIITDSAGTHGYHIGDPPDPRAIDTALSRGVDMRNLRARRFEAPDFGRFDYILAMDKGHYAFMDRLFVPPQRGKLSLFLDYSSGGPLADEVPDPYYGTLQGFEDVYDLVEKGCVHLLRAICQKHGLMY